MFMCISFPYFSSKTKFWHSFPLLQKPFFIDHILPPWEWPIKTGFHQFVLCRVPVHSYSAMCRLAYTAHTRLTHGSNIRFVQASIRSRPTAYSSPEYIDSFWSQWLSETVCNQLQQKMALHLLLRTETFMFLHKYFHCIGIVKVMFNPLKTMWQLLTQKSKKYFCSIYIITRQ